MVDMWTAILHVTSVHSHSDDFVGVAKTGSALQSLIDIVHNYSKCWYFEANVKNCGVVIFTKVGKVSGGWVWVIKAFLF